MTPIRTLIDSLDAKALPARREACKTAYHAIVQVLDGCPKAVRHGVPFSIRFDVTGQTALGAWVGSLKRWLNALPAAMRRRILETEVLA